MLKIVEAHPMDAMYLAPKLRQIDLLEVKAVDHTPYEALYSGFTMPNSVVYSGLNSKEQVVLMFGCVQSPDNKDAGCIWMLASDELDELKKDFLKISKYWVDQISSPYKYVFNFVHKTNTKSIRWLRWNGFTVDTDKIYKQGSEDFHLLIKDV